MLWTHCLTQGEPSFGLTSLIGSTYAILSHFHSRCSHLCTPWGQTYCILSVDSAYYNAKWSMELLPHARDACQWSSKNIMYQCNIKETRWLLHCTENVVNEDCGAHFPEVHAVVNALRMISGQIQIWSWLWYFCMALFHSSFMNSIIRPSWFV